MPSKKLLTHQKTPARPLCSGLNAHSMSDPHMQVEGTDRYVIHRVCTQCGYRVELPHSQRATVYVDNYTAQVKKQAADSTRKELLQPVNQDGSLNDEFTEAYGFNPLDPKTKLNTPVTQGGMR